MLTVAASLLVQTMRAVTALPLGFDSTNVIAIGLSPDRTKVDTLAARAAFESELLEAIRALPDVVAAGVGTRPLDGGGMGAGITRPEDPLVDIRISVDAVSPGYLEALGARLTSGRFFAESDHSTAPLVALINDSAARQYWPEGALGRTLIFNRQPIQVVGTLGDVRTGELEEDPPPILYFPSVQTRNFSSNSMLVRTSVPAEDVIPAIRAQVRRIDPKLPLTGVETLEQRLARALAQRQFTLWLVGLFSVIAMILAAIGIYGVISESVGQRIPEIGVRMTLGATSASVMALILREGVVLILAGVAIGTGAALAANGVMSAFVFGVQTTDIASYAAACVALVAATLAACSFPARRAVRIDPVIALRHH